MGLVNEVGEERKRDHQNINKNTKNVKEYDRKVTDMNGK